MISIRDHLPLILGVIAIGVVVWLLWRDIGTLRKTITKVVTEHNETASVLDQHKNAINSLTTQMVSGYDDDEFDEDVDEIPSDNEPVSKVDIEEIQEDPKYQRKQKKNA